MKSLDHLTMVMWMSPAGELHKLWTTPERAEEMRWKPPAPEQLALFTIEPETGESAR